MTVAPSVSGSRGSTTRKTRPGGGTGIETLMYCRIGNILKEVLSEIFVGLERTGNVKSSQKKKKNLTTMLLKKFDTVKISMNFSLK